MAGDVSARAVRAVVELAARHGVGADELLRGLPLTPEALGRPGRVDWPVYLDVIERFDGAFGADRADRIVAGAPPSRAPELGRLAGLFVGPAAFYEFVWRRRAPADWGCVRTAVDRLEESVELSCEILPGYRESRTWMRLAAAGLSGAISALGFPPARVDADVTPQRGRYRVDLPPSRTLAARLRRASRAFVAEAVAFELEVDGRDLREAREAVAACDARLTAQIERGRRTQAALVAAIEALPGAALLVGPGDRPRGANAAGAALLAARGGGLPSELRADGGGWKVTSLDAHGLPGHFLAVRRQARELVGARTEELGVHWGLTDRQRSVLGLLVRGKSNAELAEELGCAVRTVEDHVKQIMDRAGAETRSMLVYRFWSGVRA